MDALLSSWTWPLPSLAACAVALIVYFLFVRPLEASRIASFLCGVALFLLTIASPLDRLARQYLQSVEAIMHVLLALLIPLFLIGGITPFGDRSKPGNRAIPFASWIIGALTISVWFLPAVFNATANSNLLWGVMQITLTLGGVAFWWPIFGPSKAQKIKPVPSGTWYLLGAMIWCSFSGMLLAFTNSASYQPYVQVKDALGILPFIRNDLELSRSADQDTAGLFFWIGTMAILLMSVMVLYYRWYQSPEVRNEFEIKAAEEKAREGQA